MTDVYVEQLTSRGEVNVGPLQDAFKECGRTAGEVAAAMGWYRMNHGCKFVDGHRVNRTLGLTQESRGLARGGGTKFRKAVTAEMAMRLLDAMGVDHVEFGL